MSPKIVIIRWDIDYGSMPRTNFLSKIPVVLRKTNKFGGCLPSEKTTSNLYIYMQPSRLFTAERFAYSAISVNSAPLAKSVPLCSESARKRM